MRKKGDQGHHECEVIGGGCEAAEVSAAWTRCAKNPGHVTFVPVPKFNLAHLPEPWRKQSLFDHVKNVAARTVRLRVGYTSNERPDGYCFAKDKGKDILHIGSGWLYKINPRVDPCRCHACARSANPPRQKWYELLLGTACHVVYNSEEARSTRVDFFFDDERSRVTGKVRTLRGLKVMDKEQDEDWCIVVCATHDQRLAEQLRDCLRERTALYEALKAEIPSAPPVGSQELCVIVSHPHGQPKKITVGQVEGWTGPPSDFLRRMTYNTDTCPGSSGAPVLAVGVHDDLGYLINRFTWMPPHSEGGLNRGLNKSGTGLPLTPLRCET